MPWGSILAALGKILTPFLIFFKGKSDGKKEVETERLKAENEILQEQRDNDIDTIDGANSFWVRYTKGRK